MNKNYFIKTSIAIFVFLGIVISLFPPFEFSKRNYIKPIKHYDFIFGSNEKNIAVGQETLFKKFYNSDTLYYYKNLWNESDFNLYKSSTDTFFTVRKFLFKQKMPNNKKKSWIIKGDIMDEQAFNEAFSGNFYNTKYDNLEAINYDKVKDEYLKSPKNWGYHWVNTVDSVKKYDEYKITYPTYRLLDRKILFGELMVEYILAFFISIIVGYLISIFISRKQAHALSS